MNKLFKIELFLISRKNNLFFLFALFLYTLVACNIYVWNQKNKVYIENSNHFNKIYFDSLYPILTFTWGLIFVYSYFSETKNGFYSRLIINDYNRGALLKLQHIKIFYLWLFNFVLFLILYYLVQYMQFDAIKYQVNKVWLFFLLHIFLVVFYSLSLSYFLCLYTNNMILSIFGLYFITKMDVLLFLFEQNEPLIAKLNYLPISAINHSNYNNISYLSYLIFGLYMVLLFFLIKIKQAKINF
jgi:hypothetical protein